MSTAAPASHLPAALRKAGAAPDTTKTRAAKPAPKQAAAASPAASPAANPAADPAVKTIVKAASAEPAKPAKPAKAVKPAKADKAVKAIKALKPSALEKPRAVVPKVEKSRLVRDSFTMPQADFNLVAVLKTRALGFKRPTKKSELLRAGLHALQSLNDAALHTALDALVALKPGRPKNEA